MLIILLQSVKLKELELQTVQLLIDHKALRYQLKVTQPASRLLPVNTACEYWKFTPKYSNKIPYDYPQV